MKIIEEMIDDKYSNDNNTKTGQLDRPNKITFGLKDSNDYTTVRAKLTKLRN